MKKLLCWLCLITIVLSLPVFSASADRMYLIPDSNTRRLTEKEIWEWDRESIGFLFNELFARHGYVFIKDGKYDLWFSAMPWYKPNKNPNNQTQVYPKLSDLEWDNYKTIKKVAAQMDAKKEKGHNKNRKCYRDYSPPTANWTLTGFSYLELKGNQKLAVYSAPSESSWRGANGKAAVSTNGGVWAAGWENNWLLIFYETNNHSVRVGYVNGKNITGKVKNTVQLDFDKVKTKTTKACTLTDDPLMAGTSIAKLKKGATVTYLTSVINQNYDSWDYVEVKLADGQKARGFLPQGCIPYMENEEEIDY